MFKMIVVHLDDSPCSVQRLNVATRLAAEFGDHKGEGCA
jgi:hypothetical protein